MQNLQEINRAMIHETVEKMDRTLPLQIRERIEEALVQKFVDGKPLKEVLHTSTEIVNEIYQQGYHYFQAGKFDLALAIFQFGHELAIERKDMIFGIAASYHRLRRYIDAIPWYTHYITQDVEDPTTRFYLYDCFKQLKFDLVALWYLEEALVVSKRHQELHGRLIEEIELEKRNFMEKFSSKIQP